jgi:hypothetical protein
LALNIRQGIAHMSGRRASGSFSAFPERGQLTDGPHQDMFGDGDVRLQRNCSFYLPQSAFFGDMTTDEREIVPKHVFLFVNYYVNHQPT